MGARGGFVLSVGHEREGARSRADQFRDADSGENTFIYLTFLHLFKCLTMMLVEVVVRSVVSSVVAS